MGFESATKKLSPEEWEAMKAAYNSRRQEAKMKEFASAKPPSDTGWVKFGKKTLIEAWKGTSPSEKLILFHLTLYANKFGKAWPSVRRIARELEINKDTVVLGIKSLEEKKLIKRVKGQGRHSVYELLKI